MADDDLAVRESYLAVFAGAERDYQIGSPAGLLLKPIFANRDEAAKALGGGRDGAPSLVLEEDSAGHRRLTGLHLAQWAEGYAVNLDVMEVPVPAHVRRLESLRPMDLDYDSLAPLLEDLSRGFLKQWVDRNLQ